MCLMIILTNCVSDAEGLIAYRFGSNHDMIIVIHNRKHNIYLLTNGKFENVILLGKMTNYRSLYLALLYDIDL